MKQQVISIHGGDVHNSNAEFIRELKKTKADKDDFTFKMDKGWKAGLQEKLGSNYEIFTPEMPNWMSSKYAIWKIWFEKMLPFIHEGPIYIGHSLGGIFLARYFAENKDTKNMKALFLLAAPYRDVDSKDKLADFRVPKNLGKLKGLGNKVHLLHSEDDPIVSFKSFGQFKKLLPEAQTRVFKDKGHFILPEFPEMIEEIKSVSQ